MGRILLRISTNLFVRNHLYSPAHFRHGSSCPWLLPLGGAPTRSRLVFFSSESDPSRKPEWGNLPGSRSSGDDEDVSSEELKKRIKSFMDGEDEDALPTIFEAILKRKLSGRHEESDNELMEELQEKHPVDTAEKGDDVDSDFTTDDLEDEDQFDTDSDSD
ncbi:PREDICTED: uncharacterized protein LOC104812151 [Tarenaya hassleriana]|uniref:uncharacterized protein LOC104812151 n=1 Tax=Tarenaya hassleriana TaxID=28532 RepID=UPI00053C69C8|nr:PREDICTED: uncharacterized protein LOC104812151 [Tarenaya hassleriana]